MPNRDQPIDMTYEEARKIIEKDSDKRAIKHLVDDVYPWWVTFKKPFIILSMVIGILCIAIIFLSLTLQNLSAAREKDNERTECYNLFTNASTEAIGRVRAASTNIDVTGWEALVHFADTGSISQEDVSGITDLATVARNALEIDAERLQERSAWIDAGKPLPCPINEEDIPFEENQ